MILTLLCSIPTLANQKCFFGNVYYLYSVNLRYINLRKLEMKLRFTTSTIYAILHQYLVPSTSTNQPWLFTFTVFYYHYFS